ncbi:methionine ABC transporter substrate-binding protein [Leptotrichia sp. OH3620_COT-345]|uniref:MetQ/NlpA family ABC transporter substrate-binding protein n=1 Tax=Leptotrichia sp. OH3620_COT-345 TaxID=2491048 RepID=UPI000F648799|nr:MetQ/NlpA family ABC transporter substrate-binding protein [Leptotrichia sp. OH3620_COT-345]RRD38279.1 methionine ABC transporter substrate-binding protein [Leptotrichia sp. OH3620_COT-345]
MKKIIFLTVILIFTILSCGNGKDNKITDGKNEKLVVAATPVPAGELIELVKEELKKDKIDLEVLIFNDYIQPNKALQDKSADANLFQHVPYMSNFGTKNGFEMEAVGKIYLPTMALYSDKVKSLEELREGAIIFIPNDPTNLTRALLLLDKKGLIKLKDNTKLDSKLSDITENMKKLKFVEFAADQIAPRYREADAAFITGSYALDSGLNPKNNGILSEEKDSPYVNVLATLKGRKNEEKIQKLLKALQSEKVKKYIEEKYKDVIIPAF